MNDNELSENLSSVFRTVFRNERIHVTAETTARDVAGWDSLNHIQLILAVEGRFGIRFKHAEVASFKNVGDMMNAIRRHAGASLSGGHA